MPHSFDTGRPIYLQLLEQLRYAIVSGNYAPGEKMPGVRELAAQYGVNPNTVQRTMTELERQGLVYAERTAGRFVTDDEALISETRLTIARQLAHDYLKTMQDLGMPVDEIRLITQSIHETLLKGE